jgi:pSer/pThr/pTyr-binding forkhead associated (FHA) protein
MKLIVLKNNVPINQVELDVADLDEVYEIYVGRSEDCHVLIDDPLISRHHFVIKNESAEWFCEKLTQLGVVLVNGSVAPKNKLVGGDEIKCGVYTVIVADLPHSQLIREEVLQDVREELPVQEKIKVPSPPAPLSTVAVNDVGLLDTDENLSLSSLAEAELVVDEALTEESLEENKESNESADQILEEESLDNQLQDDFSQSSDGFNSDQVEQAEDFGGDPGSSLDTIPDQEGEGSGDEGTRVFRAFVNYQLVLFGEKAPYDRYLIESDEVFIGRDSKKCQIVLDDPEVSSVHAVVRKNGNDITVEDLNSSNGTILNGERINKSHVNTGDDFIVGSTTFTLEVKSDLLDAESQRLMPVESGQFIETEEIQEEEVSLDDGQEGINFENEAPQEKSLVKRILKNPQQRKKAIYGLVGIVLLWVLLDDGAEDIPQENDKSKNPEQAVVKDEKNKDKDAKSKLQLSPEQINKMSVAYELGVSFFEQGKFFEAHKEFEEVKKINPEYKKVQSYFDQTAEALRRIEELEKEKRAEAERLEKKKKIEELLVKARDAVKEKKVQVAESLFGQIAELDPENIEVGQLKLELDAWQKEEERKALEEAAKIAARKKMVDQLSPGKTAYLKKEWYKSILRLEEFMQIKGMDEDLVKEGSEMLSDAKNQLASDLGPIIGKARSLKEGQDFKNAYEAYLEVLKLEPTNPEALNEVDDIKSQLDSRSKKIYREAIISESLSLFNDAKEKFQEVQQISPTDSEYYRKATDKLKNYLE